MPLTNNRSVRQKDYIKLIRYLFFCFSIKRGDVFLRISRRSYGFRQLQDRNVVWRVNTNQSQSHSCTLCFLDLSQRLALTYATFPHICRCQINRNDLVKAWEATGSEREQRGVRTMSLRIWSCFGVNYSFVFSLFEVTQFCSFICYSSFCFLDGKQP